MAADKPTYSLAARCAAEAVGTFTIVAGGCGAVSAARYAGGPPIAASAFAGSVMIGVYATGSVSGAHLNPAVTAACVATSKPGPCSAEEGLCYAASQTVGAFLAACCNYGMYKHGIRALEKTEGSAAWGNAFGVAHNPKFLGTRALFLTEIGSTAALLFGVNAIVDPELGAPAPAAPFLIGSIVGLLIFVTGPVSGCGMNPARDVGPRLVTLLASGPSSALGPSPAWTYTLGPVLGAIVGSTAFSAFKSVLHAKPDA